MTNRIFLRRLFAVHYWRARQKAARANTMGAKVVFRGEARLNRMHWLHYQRLTVWRPAQADHCG